VSFFETAEAEQKPADIRTPRIIPAFPIALALPFKTVFMWEEK
jgi:hypothetical protein